MLTTTTNWNEGGGQAAALGCRPLGVRLSHRGPPSPLPVCLLDEPWGYRAVGWGRVHLLSTLLSG